MFLSIVIAVYNEEGNVAELTRRIYTEMEKLGIPFELIYSIDGNDNSYPILKEIAKVKNNLILDHSEKPRGFRNAFVKGFSLVNSKATHILTLDGDLNHQPEEFFKLINKAKQENSDLVIGSRYISGGKIQSLALWKRGVSTFANFVIKKIWKIKVADKTSGFRLYKKQVIDELIPKCKANNFEFLFELLIMINKKYSIAEVPITYIAREEGESKFQLFRVIKGYFKLLFRRFD